MPNEADTQWNCVVPTLHAAGWDNEPQSIAEQCTNRTGRSLAWQHHSQRQNIFFLDVAVADADAAKIPIEIRCGYVGVKAGAMVRRDYEKNGGTKEKS